MIAHRGARRGRAGVVLAVTAGIALLTLGCAPGIVASSPAAPTDGADTPLIFVDGVVYEADLADLDRDGIERIEIVKPPRSEKLSGPRARVGAVQIFMKKPAPPTP